MRTRILSFLFHLITPPEFTVKEQKAIVDSFPEPRDDYDRVFYNYSANQSGLNRAVTGMINAACLLAIPFFLLLYCFNRVTFRKRWKREKHEAILLSSCNRMGARYSYEGRIPQELYSRYRDVTVLDVGIFPRFSEGVMGWKAFRVWGKMFLRHPVSGFLLLRCLVNLMGFNRLILQHRPKAIINARAELNTVSSLITCFCESKQVDYDNFMHGEVMATMSTAFVRFTEFYIWDEDYAEVFCWGRCPMEQFTVYTPDIYRKKLPEDVVPKYYLTYMFCGDEKTHGDANAETVKKVLLSFTAEGKKCKVRPHPRWSDRKQMERVFGGSGIDIENPREVSTEASIANSEKIAGTFSTVLSEAYYYGKTVVIDDISDDTLIRELQDKMYILLNKPHELLSDLYKD